MFRSGALPKLGSLFGGEGASEFAILAKRKLEHRYFFVLWHRRLFLALADGPRQPRKTIGNFFLDGERRQQIRSLDAGTVPLFGRAPRQVKNPARVPHRQHPKALLAGDMGSA